MAVCEKSQSAKVVITDVKGKDHTVSIFEPILSRLVSGHNMSVKLLTAPQFVFTVKTKEVVFSVKQID